MYPLSFFGRCAFEAQRLSIIAFYHNARHIKRKTFFGGGLFSM